MSRLPMISTPGRMGTPPTPGGTGIPTPTHRRPRSSLGPNPSLLSASVLGKDNDEMDQALKEVLRTRPPSSLKNRLDDKDPETPPMQAPNYGHLAPRTPGLRPRTPGAGVQTPGVSRAVSRSSTSSRPSVTGTNTFTPRRTSMASSTTSTTPYAKRPESRASMAGGAEEKFCPVVGDRVRMQSMGMEGTLKYIGETEFKAGVWAGVELEGGFAGKGKNDGSVNGVPYFTCPPLCGVFVLAAKLSPPTSGMSRPASVASSHRSLASSRASYSLSGRMTPSERPRPMTTTPGRGARIISTSVRGRALDDDDESRPTKTLLGTSTSTNAGVGTNITAGSRASKYLGMTAKQLDSARAGTLNSSVRTLRESTTTTPKAPRVSMNGVTPVRPRQSMGGSFATPKPRVPRASQAIDSMPPPPSPGNIGRTLHAQQAQLDEEIRELKRRNAELEAELKDYAGPANAAEERQKTEALQAEVDRVREEADALRNQLNASQADAADASKLAEELQNGTAEVQGQIEEKERELARLRKEMSVAAERAQGELDAGMEAKREEVRQMQERAEIAESEGAEMRALVEELTQAGQATISLYETKQYDLEDKIRTLEDKSRLLEEKLAKAREESAKAPESPSLREAATAAEIDNETLTAQLKHLQQKLSNLEEELEETRAQAESDAESWKARLAKAKDGERTVLDREREVKEEVKRLQKAAEGAKSRIAELEGALKENNSALEGARAEIESLRGEAAEASSMRSALADAGAKEKLLAEKTSEVETLRKKVDTLGELESKLQSAESERETLEAQKKELVTKVASLEADIVTIKAENLPQQASPGSNTSQRKTRLSTGSSSDDDSKRLRGFQHIIQELSAENAEVKDKYQAVLEEVALLKEEIKLLEETNDLDGSKPSVSKELVEAKAAVLAHAQTIKELNREVSELESLIESKIYREDELETRLADLERELSRRRADSQSQIGAAALERPSHSCQPSHADSAATEDRCELCEGPHDLDACPVFAGNMGGGDGTSPSNGKTKKGKWCADCESAAHDTEECPMAEDVF